MADNGFATFARARFQSMRDLSPQPCIYKAPNHIREVNEECYRPYVVSIGPLYYGLPSLEVMQDCKWSCLKLFLDHDNNSYKSNLEHYLRIIEDLEGSIRHSYTEGITLPSGVFNGMILLDSAFIICLFMSNHPILSSSMAVLFHMCKRSLLKWGPQLTRDLFLLENQVPFFVLERLFQEAFGAAHSNISFLDLSLGYIMNSGIPVTKKHHISAATAERIKNAPEIAHLVDLLRIFCFPSIVREQTVEPTKSTNVLFPSDVSHLRAVGVKFVASKSTNLLDLTFCKGVLEIPPIQIRDSSESYYRSMILFEQSHAPISRNSYMVDYMAVLQKLIRTPEDVQILVDCGIIDNRIGREDAVVRLFNDITKHLVFPNQFYFVNVCQDLNAYANTRWNQWKAILKRDYFSHPWATISVVCALILLILSILETVATFTKN